MVRGIVRQSVSPCRHAPLNLNPKAEVTQKIKGCVNQHSKKVIPYDVDCVPPSLV